MTSRIQVQRNSIEQRRSRVIELSSKGKKPSEIAEILGISESTVCRDYQHINANAKKIAEHYLYETAPLELAKCLIRINAVSEQAWKMVEQASNYREKIAALSLAMRAAVQLANVVSTGSNISRRNAIEMASSQEPLESQVDQEHIEKLNGDEKIEKRSKPDPAETVF